MAILTIPNFITFFRLVLILPFVFLLSMHETIFAALLFIVIAVLDGVDGFIARSMKQQSKFGEMLDSTSDVTLLVVSFLSLGYFGYIQKEWHLLLGICAIFLVVSKLLHYYLSKETASTLQGKFTALAAYATILSSAVSLPFNSALIVVFIASSLYTSVHFLLYAFKNSQS